MSIHSRVSRIEAAIGKNPDGAIILREPVADATGESHQIFEQELTTAIASGLRVIVLTSGEAPRLRVPGVSYTADSFDAFLTKLAMSPATDGRSRDLLSQVITEICATGSTLPVVAEVNDGEV